MDKTELMTEVTYWIEGLTPLMQHSPRAMTVAKTGLGKKKIPSPEDEAELGTYRLANNQLGHPSRAFIAALMKACIHRRIGKKAAKGVLQSVVFNIEDQEFVALVDPETREPLREYVIDTRRAVVQGQGVMRSRPKVLRWACFLKLEADTEFVAESGRGGLAVITEILNIAGRSVGIGELRPAAAKGTGGRYGKFTATLVTGEK